MKKFIFICSIFFINLFYCYGDYKDLLSDSLLISEGISDSIPFYKNKSFTLDFFLKNPFLGASIEYFIPISNYISFDFNISPRYTWISSKNYDNDRSWSSLYGIAGFSGLFSSIGAGYTFYNDTSISKLNYAGKSLGMKGTWIKTGPGGAGYFSSSEEFEDESIYAPEIKKLTFIIDLWYTQIFIRSNKDEATNLMNLSLTTGGYEKFFLLKFRKEKFYHFFNDNSREQFKKSIFDFAPIINSTFDKWGFDISYAINFGPTEKKSSPLPKNTVFSMGIGFLNNTKPYDKFKRFILLFNMSFGLNF
jgi:hypothetical protein